MQYMVAHLLREPIKSYHETLATALSSRFLTSSVLDRIVSHITLKAPFEHSNAEEIITALDACIKTLKPIPFDIVGFDHFNNRVLFLSCRAPEESLILAKTIVQSLQTIPGITSSPYDGAGTFHVTLAYARDEKEGRAMRAYLAELPEPRLESAFDNVALLKKVEGKWYVERVWDITL